MTDLDEVVRHQRAAERKLLDLATGQDVEDLRRRLSSVGSDLADSIGSLSSGLDMIESAVHEQTSVLRGGFTNLCFRLDVSNISLRAIELAFTRPRKTQAEELLERAEHAASRNWWEEARQAAEEAIKLNPLDPRPHFYLGRSLVALDIEPEEALASFDRSAKYADSDMPYVGTLALAAGAFAADRMNDWSAVERRLERAVTLGPWHVDSFLGLASEYCRQREYQAARDSLKKAFTLNPLAALRALVDLTVASQIVEEVAQEVAAEMRMRTENAEEVLREINSAFEELADECAELVERAQELDQEELARHEAPIQKNLRDVKGLVARSLGSERAQERHSLTQSTDPTHTDLIREVVRAKGVDEQLEERSDALRNAANEVGGGLSHICRDLSLFAGEIDARQGDAITKRASRAVRWPGRAFWMAVGLVILGSMRKTQTIVVFGVLSFIGTWAMSRYCRVQSRRWDRGGIERRGTLARALAEQVQEVIDGARFDAKNAPELWGQGLAALQPPDVEYDLVVRTIPRNPDERRELIQIMQHRGHELVDVSDLDELLPILLGPFSLAGARSTARFALKNEAGVELLARIRPRVQ